VYKNEVEVRIDIFASIIFQKRKREKGTRNFDP